MTPFHHSRHTVPDDLAASFVLGNENLCCCSVFFVTRDGLYDAVLEDAGRVRALCCRHHGVGSTGIVEVRSHPVHRVEVR